jgi:ATP-dependent exoDNAse (exonuclease V) beta subunit
VTSILSATKPEEAKQALRNWRKRIGREKAQQITTDASRRGTSLHSAIACFLKEQQIPEDIEDNLYWRSIFPVLERVARTHLVESAIYHRDCKYAGVFDCLGEWQGKLCLFDWKTASQPKKIEWIDDYCLQVAAYIAAINNLYNVRITEGIVAIALKDFPAQIFYLNSELLDYYWEQFLARLRLWENL